MSWSYDEALAWLYGRQRLGIKLGLDKVHRLLASLGDPQDAFHAVHVAGTNGKGSVVGLLAGVLERAGQRVGATTSPHLVRFTERIRIDGEPATEDEVAAGLARIRPAVEALDAEGLATTFFEAVTALAFLVFRDRGVTWAVVETGMGGRLDATNVLRPRLTIITNVDLDHQAFLGAHVAEVAWEKAGIMKPGVPCVTAAGGEALLVIKSVSHEVQAPMSIVGEDYLPVPDVNGLRLASPHGEARYDLAVAGAHQIENAAVVAAAVDALRAQGVGIPPTALQNALAETRLPGRLESFHRRMEELVGHGEGRQRGPSGQRTPSGPPGPPTRGLRIEVLLDGAHNAAAASALRRHLVHRDWAGFHLVAGFNADKPWQDMLAQWAPLAAHVWAVPLCNPRSLDPEAMRPFVAGFGIPFDACLDVRQALACAAHGGAERVVVAGSLFLVGEARAVLTGQPLEEIQGAQ